MAETVPDLQSDSRWLLIERITASPPFQKSARLRDLLRFLAERTLHGHHQDLTEHNIGHVVFGKPKDYSVVEDSSVRVHVRQLRLKLHEYFDGEGRGERYIVEIPKGAYSTLFRAVEPEASEAAPPVPRTRWQKPLMRWLPWALAALFLVTTVVARLRPTSAGSQAPPWPLSALFHQPNSPVQVVVADINYGMMRLVEEQPVTLEQYLSPSYRGGSPIVNDHPTPREARVARYLSGSLLTSYADLVTVSNLMRLAGNSSDWLAVRSARELHPRELETGNFVFIGSPSSNPWVSYFQGKLNFQEREGVVGESPKFFQNLHPKPGEQDTYRGLAFTGSAGTDYATISLLPLPSGRGSVLILQGLQQEGTEAAGLFLADAENRRKLEQALGFSGAPKQPVYFEALIRTDAIAGSSNATSIVSARLLHP